MIELRDQATDQVLGTIQDDEFRFLTDQLEEESTVDRDYYISVGTIDMLEANGAPPSLITLLRQALGDQEGLDVRWVQG